MNHVPLVVAGKIVGVSLYPWILLSHMVWHPVEPHFDAQLVSTGHESLHIADGSISWINRLVVHSGIGAVHGSSARVDGHEPDDVYSQRVKAVQLPGGCLECALGGKRTHIHLIDDAVAIAHRFGVIDRQISRNPAAGCQ